MSAHEGIIQVKARGISYPRNDTGLHLGRVHVTRGSSFPGASVAAEVFRIPVEQELMTAVANTSPSAVTRDVAFRINFGFIIDTPR
jgi:hypothetical protein